MLLLFVTMINKLKYTNPKQLLNFRFLLKQAYLYIMIYIFRCLANSLTLSSVKTSSLGSSPWSLMGLDAFTKKLKEKKWSSMDWVIPSEKFLKIKLPLAEFVKTQSKVIMAASSIVKQFIGKSTPYGTGHCYLWEHGVDCTLVSLSVISLSFFCVM